MQGRSWLGAPRAAIVAAGAATIASARTLKGNAALTAIRRPAPPDDPRHQTTRAPRPARPQTPAPPDDPRRQTPRAARRARRQTTALPDDRARRGRYGAL